MSRGKIKYIKLVGTKLEIMDYEAVRLISEAKGVSISNIVRKAIKKYIKYKLGV